jgi:hypothetical protein
VGASAHASDAVIDATRRARQRAAELALAVERVRAAVTAQRMALAEQADAVAEGADKAADLLEEAATHGRSCERLAFARRERRIAAIARGNAAWLRNPAEPRPHFPLPGSG